MSLSEDLLQQMLENLRLLTDFTLREVDATDISGSQTVQPSRRFTIYEQGRQGGQGGRMGEVFLIILSASTSNYVLRVTVDQYEAWVSPRTSELMTAGVNSPDLIWGVNPTPGVNTIVCKIRFPFKEYVKVEGQNVGTNSSTATSYVSARLFNPD